MISSSIHNIFKKTYSKISEVSTIFDVIKSLIIVLIYYQKDTISKKDVKSAVFIGNSDFDNATNVKKSEFIAVSNFMIFDKILFQKINPTHYFLVDPLFFCSKAERFKSFWIEINNQKKEFFLVVPALYIKKAKKLVKNDKVKLCSLCLSPINGPYAFITFLTKIGLGSYKVKNVLGAFLVFCIRNNIKNIDLYGANHDWSRFMYLNQKKILCLGEGSHNSKESSSGNIWYKYEDTPWRVSEAYFSLYEAFKFYEVYSDYFEENNFLIHNHSKNSLIQNFK